MDSKFYFSKIRSSVTKPNQIMIQGMCTKDFMDGVTLDVMYRDGNDDCRLNTSYSMNQIPVTQDSYIKDENIKYKITFSIDMPENIADKASLRLIIDGKLIYKCSGEKLKKAAGEINTCIENISSDGTHLIIKGWCIDKADIDIDVVDSEGVSRKDKLAVDWYMRSDVAEEFAELSEPVMAGFVLRFPHDIGKATLKLTAGDKVNSYPIGGMSGYGSTSPIGSAVKYAKKTVDSLKDYGFKATLERAKHLIERKTRREVKSYEKWIKKKMPTPHELAEQRKVEFSYRPKFSILVPMYETDENYLKELVASVCEQTYSDWELCLSDGSKSHDRLRRIVEQLAKKDDRIRYIAKANEPLGISENTNQALAEATGDYIVLGDHDDLFTPDALYECVKALNEKKVDVIYTDEDKVDSQGTTFFEPNFKPDFNIDLLRSNNYICHMFVASKKLVDSIGNFNSEYNGAQDYDFIFRCVEKADGIHHIPKILYRWRSHAGSTAEAPEAKLYAFEAGKRAIEAHYKRMGIKAIVEHGDDWGFYKTTYEIEGSPLLSIVIPNKDHVTDLKKCMDAIDEKSDYRNYEYVIVENNSEQDETFKFYDEISKRKNVNVLYWEDEFNYSAINNYGVANAKGEYVLLLNNDTEIINSDCLSQMIGYCQREEVGAVGARLYYEDGSIQHAGVVIGFGGIAGHAFVGLREEAGLYQSRTKVACDYSAVTAACLMTKKSVFEEVGGLEESFKVAFNDIDFCMKIRKTGKLIVYNPNAKLYHYESKSRGLEDTPEKIERFNSEMRRFQNRWPEILDEGDPYYNVNLTLDKADFSCRA